MKPILSRQAWVVALLSVCLWTVSTQAQQRNTGGGGGGNRSSGSSYRGGGGGGYGGGSSGGGAGSSTRDYNNNTMLGDATITSDPETRRIIVITDEETAQSISQVVSNLDKPKPQVLIKVVFMEVTHNNGLDFGVEANYKNVNNNNSTTNLLSSGLGLAAANATPAGGIYQILGSDYSATVRALETAGKTEVLSRPSVLVRNNQPATITIGETVPFITATRYDAVNGQINTVTYEDIGIILRVTPFITSDGLVQMMVAPEISSVLDSSHNVQIGSGVSAFVVSKRSADTVVVTPDGVTVVIGGLMANEKIASENKVPFLGDIPYLGVLFKHKTTQDTKTELVIFLTPHVVLTPTRLPGETKMETDKLQLAPNAFSQKELDQFLDGVPMKKPDKSKDKSKAKDK